MLRVLQRGISSYIDAATRLHIAATAALNSNAVDRRFADELRAACDQFDLAWFGEMDDP